MNDPVNKLSSAEPAGSAAAAKSPGLLGQHLAHHFYPHINAILTTCKSQQNPFHQN